MANWGIGLGALAQGVSKGVDLGEKIGQAHREAKARDDYVGALGLGKQDFEAAVSKGEADANDVPASMRFAAPHVMRAAMANRDLQGLKFFTEWQASDEARAGSKLFESGLRRAQVGDLEGGWSDFQKLGKLKGYGGQYDVGPLTKNEDGQYTTTIKSAEGKIFTPTFADPVKFQATFGNPAIAFQDMRASQKREEEAALDAKKYGARKDLDLDHQEKLEARGLGQSYQPQNVVQTDENGKTVTRPYVVNSKTGVAAPLRDAEGNEVAGEMRRPGGGAGGAGSKTGQTERIIADLRKENPGMTYAEALALTKRAPDGDRTKLREETLALSAAKADVNYLTNPTATLEKWRKKYVGSSQPAPAAPATKQPDAEPAPAPAPAAKGDKGAIGTIAGSGTQADPFKASTQTHIDWFKQNAPAGAVLDVNGKRYTK